MAPFTGFTARKNLYKNREGSSLTSQGERNSVLKDWKSLREDAFRSDKTNQMLSQIREQVARLSQRFGTSNNLHPFKIYNFPSALRLFHNDNDWRRFKVRDGFISLGSNPNIIFPTIGSDAALQFDCGATSDAYLSSEIPPNNSSSVVTGDWHEAIVPVDGNTYYFWVSICVPQPPANNPIGILFGSSNVGATYMGTGDTVTDPWPTFPEDDPYHKVIGSVRIPTVTTPPIEYKNVPIIVQQASDEVMCFPQVDRKTNSGSGPTVIHSPFQGSVMAFQGTYQAGRYYFSGDVVQTITLSATSNQWLNTYVLMPNQATEGPYDPLIIGPLIGVSPDTHNPDPWMLLSKSPLDVDYHNDASYQAAKNYLRTA